MGTACVIARTDTKREWGQPVSLLGLTQRGNEDSLCHC